MPKNIMRKLIAVALFAGTSAVWADTTSTFDVDADGWKMIGDSTTSVPTFMPAGGNTDGYIHGTDQTTGGVWYWLAPTKFNGDNSASYNQTLSFDLRMRGSGSLFESSDVILEGAGTSLHYDFAMVPANTSWTSYSVALNETAGWRFGSLSGAFATQAQILSVLGNTSSLRIRGEFITGSDNGDLDNVIMAAVPEPETYAMMLAGLGLLGAVARRRKV